MSRPKVIRTALFLAGRSLVRSNPGISFLTTFMMTLVFLNLIFLPSVIDKAQIQVDQNLTDFITSDLLILPGGSGSSLTANHSFMGVVRNAPGVKSASPVFRAGTQVSHKNESGAWEIAGVDPETFPDTLSTTKHMIEGRNLNPTDKYSIVLGVGIAGADHTTQRDYSRSLKTVHPGDSVKVTLITGGIQEYEVVGVYETKFPEADATAYVPQGSLADKLPFAKDQATAVYISFKDNAQKSTIESAVQAKYKDVKFRTAVDLAGAVKDIKGTLAIVNSILKGVSLLVAAITIFIITYVDLANRRKQIGIERAIGIKSSSIVISYALKAVAYAVTGVLIGVAAFLYAIVPLVNQYPFKFPIGDVTIDVNLEKMLLNGGILIGVAVVAALVPAYQSVRIRILHAIWG